MFPSVISVVLHTNFMNAEKLNKSLPNVGLQHARILCKGETGMKIGKTSYKGFNTLQ